MQAILGDIGALMGVTGSFVCGGEGGLLGRAMPAGMDDAGLTAIGRSLMQTFNGLEADRHKRATEFHLVFNQGQLLVKNLGAGCLCVLCTRQANVAMVNMTANMAVRKLKDILVATVPPEPPLTPAASAPAPLAAAAGPAPVATPSAASDTVDAALVTQIEHELARAVGPVAMLTVDDAVAGLGCTRHTLPKSALPAWIERVGAEIPDPAKRTQFVRAARQIGRLEQSSTA